jgi:hypothetical protein
MIDPDFWTDQKILTLPLEKTQRLQARLLYPAMWNFADDHGILPDEPHRMAAQAPAVEATPDDIETIWQTMAELGMIIRYVANGRGYIFIPHFGDWQTITRPTYRYPTPPKFTESSLRTHEHLTEPSQTCSSEGNRRQEKAIEGNRNKEKGAPAIFSLFSAYMHRNATPAEAKQIEELAQKWPFEVIRDAFADMEKYCKQPSFVNVLRTLDMLEVKGKKGKKAHYPPGEYLQRYGHLLEGAKGNGAKS